MGTITHATDYPDGQLFDVDKHNRNIYSTAPGEGILSTLAGGVDAANLDSSLVVQQEHVFPGAIAQPSQAEAIRLVQLFGDLFGGEKTAHADVVADPTCFQAIPGLGRRVWFPFGGSARVWEWSYFFNPQRWMMNYPLHTPPDDVRESLAIIATKLDGVILPESIRPVPFSLFWNNTGTSRKVRSRTGHCSLYHDMHHTAVSNTAGWHTIEVCIYLENLQRSNRMKADTVMIKAQREDSGDTAYKALVTNAIVFGVRNVRVIDLF